MTGFEPRISGVGSNLSTNCTSPDFLQICFLIKKLQALTFEAFEKNFSSAAKF